MAFIVPADEDVCPREKFAAFLALIIQQFPATVPQPWDHEERGRVITAGEDLPYEKDQLSVFCPHKCQNNRLTTQWNLQCNTKFYFMKSNQCILNRINSLGMIGWFQQSHPKFTSRDDLVTKLFQQLDTDEKFDLHVHM
eukprot:12528770-Ditylum_brightwellii.AAC.1